MRKHLVQRGWSSAACVNNYGLLNALLTVDAAIACAGTVVKYLWMKQQASP